MKLAAFIATHMDEIVAEFVSFAATLRPAAIDISSVELRDHAREILTTIAADLDSAQTSKQKKEKIDWPSIGHDRRRDSRVRPRSGPTSQRFHAAAADRGISSA